MDIGGANINGVAIGDGNYNAAGTFGRQSITDISAFNSNAGYARIIRV